MWFALATGLLALAVTADAPAAPPPPLQGTFLQFTRARADWSEQRWEQLFHHFTELHLREIVVQWTVFDDTSFYQRRSPEVASPLATVLRLADRANIHVFVGLVNDSKYWSHIGREPQLVDIYLRRLQLRSEAVARAVAPEVRSHSSFAGWYLTEEIDDVNWTTERKRQQVVEHVHGMSATLHALTPGQPVLISGFSNGNMRPQRLARFWYDIASRGGVDRVLFQDGVGAGKLDVDDLEPYYDALNAALGGTCELQIVVELFSQIAGSPISDAPFAATGAPVERVARQLAVARSYSSIAPTAFSVPEYMTPDGDVEAVRLYEAYLRMIPPP